MRRLIFILLLLPALLQGQRVSVPVTPACKDMVRTEREAMASSYSDEYQVVHDAFTSAPEDTLAVHYNEMIDSLVYYGIWDSTEVFYLGACHDSVDSYLNWKNTNADTLTTGHRGSGKDPQWTAFEGWFNAVAADQGYLNTGWNPSSDASKFNANSGAVFIASYNDVSENKSAFGVFNTTYLRATPNNSGNIVTYFLSGYESNSSGGKSDQHLGIRKVTAGTIYYDINGTHASDAVVDAAIPDGNMFILAYNDVGAGTSGAECTNIIMYFIVTAGISEANADRLQQIMERYLDRIGRGLQ